MDNKEITFTLTQQEAQGIIQMVGQLPTSSGAFPLMQKLAQQFNIQVSQPPQL